MKKESQRKTRRVRAFHGRREIKPDSIYQVGLARYLRRKYQKEELIKLYSRFLWGLGEFDVLMRNIILRAMVKRFGNSISVEAGVSFKHPETFEIGSGVFLGIGTYFQGRHDGRCVIGNHVWIGPHSYFDARALVIEDYVGWGPGAKVLGSAHTGQPTDVPILRTDLLIKPVKIGRWADIGVNAVIMPGITVGKGSIVGAGAVVTKDIKPFSIVAGVPARFMYWRRKLEQPDGTKKEKKQSVGGRDK